MLLLLAIMDLFREELFIRFTVRMFRKRLSNFVCVLLFLLVLRVGCDCMKSCLSFTLRIVIRMAQHFAFTRLRSPTHYNHKRNTDMQRKCIQTKN